MDAVSPTSVSMDDVLTSSHATEDPPTHVTVEEEDTDLSVEGDEGVGEADAMDSEDPENEEEADVPVGDQAVSQILTDAVDKIASGEMDDSGLRAFERNLNQRFQAMSERLNSWESLNQGLSNKDTAPALLRDVIDRVAKTSGLSREELLGQETTSTESEGAESDEETFGIDLDTLTDGEAMIVKSVSPVLKKLESQLSKLIERDASSQRVAEMSKESASVKQFFAKEYPGFKLTDKMIQETRQLNPDQEIMGAIFKRFHKQLAGKSQKRAGGSPTSSGNSQLPSTKKVEPIPIGEWDGDIF